MQDIKNITQRDIQVFSLNGYMADCKNVRTVDGDTLHLVFYYRTQIMRVVCRLYGVNTPELRVEPEKANMAKRRLHELTTNADDINSNTKIIRAEFYGREKYGRELARIYDGDTCINDVLLNEGLAVKYYG